VDTVTAARIRPIASHELPELLKLYHYLLTDAPLPTEREAAALWKRICDDDKLFYFVAEVDGKLISTCTLTLIPNLTHLARSYGLIENVVTHPDYRKQGLATQVLHYALNVAWEQNCYKVMLMTGSKREETLRFYDNADFKRGIKTGFIAYPE
jgi:GNAT superfamily N-acetyltransferase